jgi:hypothetical protein
MLLLNMTVGLAVLALLLGSAWKLSAKTVHFVLDADDIREGVREEYSHEHQDLSYEELEKRFLLEARAGHFGMIVAAEIIGFASIYMIVDKVVGFLFF